MKHLQNKQRNIASQSQSSINSLNELKSFYIITKQSDIASKVKLKNTAINPTR